MRGFSSLHTRRRPGIFLLAALPLIAWLSACGSAASSSASPESTSTAQVTSSVAQLAEQAKKEGTVVWYTTVASQDIAKVVKAFNHTYPGINVQVLRLSADQLPARVLTEQRGGKFNADVISGDATQVNQLRLTGALQPYNPPDAAPVQATIQLPAGYRGVIYALTTVIAYNPTALKAAKLPVPTNWDSFTDPAWSGKFAVDNGSLNWYESLMASMGTARAQALLKAIGDNKPRLVTSHTQALTEVASGEVIGTPTAYGYLAARYQAKDPATVRFINLNPLPTELTMVDLARKAPHPFAAALFDDWLVSQAGQLAIVQITNHTSLRPGIRNDTAVWNPAVWQPVYANPLITPAQYDTYVSQYQQYMHLP
jgi:iron(III) transport system substrate-binding protein